MDLNPGQCSGQPPDPFRVHGTARHQHITQVRETGLRYVGAVEKSVEVIGRSRESCDAMLCQLLYDLLWKMEPLGEDHSSSKHGMSQQLHATVDKMQRNHNQNTVVAGQADAAVC